MNFYDIINIENIFMKEVVAMSNQKFEIKKKRRRKQKNTKKSSYSKETSFFRRHRLYVTYISVVLLVLFIIILFHLPNIILKVELKSADSQEELNLMCEKKAIDCYFQYSQDTEVDDFNVYKVRIVNEDKSAEAEVADEEISAEGDASTEENASEGATDNVTTNEKKVHIMIQKNNKGATDESEDKESES